MGGTHTAKCKWCGVKYQKGNNALVFIKLGSDFCSPKCESKYNSAQSIGGGVSTSAKVSEQKNSETERLKWEKEQFEKREEVEKKERRRAKAVELKNENKPYSAFLLQNGERIGIASLVIGIVLFLGIMQGKSIPMKVVAIIIAIVLAFVWGFLAFKYIKEYFRKE